MTSLKTSQSDFSFFGNHFESGAWGRGPLWGFFAYSRIILILQQLLICAKYLRSVECDNLVVNTTILIHLVLLDRFGSVCTAFWKWFIRFARVSTPMHKPILMGKVNNLLKSLYPYLINKCSSMNDNFMGRQKWTTFSYIQFLQKVWVRNYL